MLILKIITLSKILASNIIITNKNEIVNINSLKLNLSKF